MKKVIMIVLMIFVGMNLYGLTDYKFGEEMDTGNKGFKNKQIFGKYDGVKTKLIKGYMASFSYDTGNDSDHYGEDFRLGEVTYTAVRYEDRIKFVESVKSLLIKKHGNTIKVPFFTTISSLFYENHYKRHIEREIEETDASIIIASFEHIMKKDVDAIFVVDKFYIFDTDEKWTARIIVIPFDKMSVRMNRFDVFMKNIDG